MEKKRIEYLDVYKGIAIFLIYLFHLGDVSGDAYRFIVRCGLELFFFASGCLEAGRKKPQMGSYIVKKCRTVLVPWLFFSCASLFLWIINAAESGEAILKNVVCILEGTIRNQFLAGSLWFLTCYFVMSVLFALLRQIDNKWWIFFSCLGLSLLAKFLLHADNDPKWFWNADSALYYILFFGLGYLLFPAMNRALHREDKKGRAFVAVTAVLSAGYALCLFWGKNFLSFLEELPGGNFYGPVLTALILIWFFMLTAYALRENRFLAQLGKDTLCLCGSEWIIKTLAVAMAGIVGLPVRLDYKLSAYLYAAIVLVAADKLLVPGEKRILGKIDAVLKRKKDADCAAE